MCASLFSTPTIGMKWAYWKYRRHASIWQAKSFQAKGLRMQRNRLFSSYYVLGMYVFSSVRWSMLFWDVSSIPANGIFLTKKTKKLK